MFNSKFILLALAALTQVVFALPHYRITQRDNTVAYLARDSKDRLLAYRADGSRIRRYPVSTQPRQASSPSLTRRGASSCTSLSIDQVKALPAFSKIQQYATNTFGSGSVNIVTNPSDFPDRGALACVDTSSPVAVSTSGNLQCSSSSTVTGVASGAGTNTTATQSVQVTTTNSGSWTVTQSSSIGATAEFNVGFSIPDLFDVGASLSTTTTFTNEQSQGFSTQTSVSSSSTVNITPADGKTCNIVGNLTTCNVQGTGSINMLASGFVWFNYDDSRPLVSDPNGGSHFKFQIESVLSNDERSSKVAFQGSMSGQTTADFKTKCD
ncbi:hypothetical protein BDZ97DRAFT_1919899 [Flammula alnicola]|nr:hypothetical protein BDZ97DRAFT_1919899 [Flammula alnicola]